MSIIQAANDLCNYLKDSAYGEEFKNLIHKLNKSGKNPNDGNFGYIARHYIIQFMGYLYVNQNYEKYNQVLGLFNLKPLSDDEVLFFEKGHNFLLHINQKITKHLFQILPNAVDSLKLFDRFNVSFKTKDMIDIPSYYIDNISAQFSNHQSLSVIKKAINDLPKIKEVPKEHLVNGVNVILKEIIRSDIFEVPQGINEMDRFIPNDLIVENIGKIFRSLVCINVSIRVLNQMIFQACKGEKYTVLDNSNVYKIEKHIKYYLGESLRLKVQPNKKSDFWIQPQNCCYLDISLTGDQKIKGLFWIANYSCSISGETGETAKYWLRKIDEDLNYLYGFNH